MATREDPRERLARIAAAAPSSLSFGGNLPTPAQPVTPQAQPQPQPTTPNNDISRYLAARKAERESQRADLIAQQKAAADDGGSWWDGITGSTIGGAALTGLGYTLKPLDWLTTGGRAAVAGIENAARALPEDWEQAIDAGLWNIASPGSGPALAATGKGVLQGIDEDREDIEPWYKRAVDSSYTYGQASRNQFGNPWLDKPFNFAVDVGVDPLTYATLGSGTVAGAAGRGAVAAKMAAAGGFSDDLIKRVATRGVAYLDDAQRASLGVEKSGVRFLGQRVAGTGGLARATGRALGSTRASITSSRPWHKVFTGADGVVVDLSEARRALLDRSYDGPMTARTAAALMDFDDTVRRAKKSASVPAANEANKIFEGLDAAAQRRLTHAVESGDFDQVANALRGVNRELHRQAKEAGVNLGDLGDNFITHLWTDEAAEWLAERSLTQNGRPVAIRGSSTTRTRKLAEGKVTVSGQGVKPTEIDIGNGTIAEIEAAFTKAFGDVAGVGKWLEDDARKLTSAYIDMITTDIALGRTFREMVKKHPDVFNWLDNVGTEVLEDIGPRMKGEMKTAMRQVVAQRKAAEAVELGKARESAVKIHGLLVDHYKDRVSSQTQIGARFSKIAESFRDASKSTAEKAEAVGKQIEEIRGRAAEKVRVAEEAFYEAEERLAAENLKLASMSTDQARAQRFMQYASRVSELREVRDQAAAELAEIDDMTDVLREAVGTLAEAERAAADPDALRQLANDLWDAPSFRGGAEESWVPHEGTAFHRAQQVDKQIADEVENMHDSIEAERITFAEQAERADQVAKAAAQREQNAKRRAGRAWASLRDVMSRRGPYDEAIARDVLDEYAEALGMREIAQEIAEESKRADDEATKILDEAINIEEPRLAAAKKAEDALEVADAELDNAVVYRSGADRKAARDEARRARAAHMDAVREAEEAYAAYDEALETLEVAQRNAAATTEELDENRRMVLEWEEVAEAAEEKKRLTIQYMLGHDLKEHARWTKAMTEVRQARQAKLAARETRDAIRRHADRAERLHGMNAGGVHGYRATASVSAKRQIAATLRKQARAERTYRRVTGAIEGPQLIPPRASAADDLAALEERLYRPANNLIGKGEEAAKEAIESRQVGGTLTDRSLRDIVNSLDSEINTDIPGELNSEFRAVAASLLEDRSVLLADGSRSAKRAARLRRWRDRLANGAMKSARDRKAQLDNAKLRLENAEKKWRERRAWTAFKKTKEYRALVDDVREAEASLKLLQPQVHRAINQLNVIDEELMHLSRVGLDEGVKLNPLAGQAERIAARDKATRLWDSIERYRKAVAAGAEPGEATIQKAVAGAFGHSDQKLRDDLARRTRILRSGESSVEDGVNYYARREALTEERDTLGQRMNEMEAQARADRNWGALQRTQEWKDMQARYDEIPSLLDPPPLTEYDHLLVDDLENLIESMVDDLQDTRSYVKHLDNELQRKHGGAGSTLDDVVGPDEARAELIAMISGAKSGAREKAEDFQIVMSALLGRHVEQDELNRIYSVFKTRRVPKVDKKTGEIRFNKKTGKPLTKEESAEEFLARTRAAIEEWYVRMDPRVRASLAQSAWEKVSEGRAAVRAGRQVEEALTTENVNWRAAIGGQFDEHRDAVKFAEGEAAKLRAITDAYDAAEEELTGRVTAARARVDELQAQVATRDAVAARGEYAENALDQIPPPNEAMQVAEARQVGRVVDLEEQSNRLAEVVDEGDALLRTIDEKAADEMAEFDSMRLASEYMADVNAAMAGDSDALLKKLSAKVSKIESHNPAKRDVKTTFDQLSKLVDELDPTDPTTAPIIAQHAAMVDQMAQAANIADSAKAAERLAKRAEKGKLGAAISYKTREGWNAVDDVFVMPDGKTFAYGDEAKAAFAAFEKDLNSNKYLQMFDTMTQLFKTYAVATPGFHVRNAMSAAFMNMVAGVGVESQIEANRLFGQFVKNPQKFMREINDPRIREAFEATFGSGAGGSFSAAELGNRHNLVFDNAWTRLNRRAGERVEGSVRLAMALDSIKARGMDVHAAQARIEAFHFDYSKLSQLDRGIKRAIPFWTFMSRNLPLQLQMMYTRPGLYATFDKLQANMPHAENLPGWLDARGPLGLGVDDEGAAHSLGIDLPHLGLSEDVGQFMSGRAFLGNLNPVVVGPVEALLNENLYFGNPITDEEGLQGAVDRSAHILQSVIPPIQQLSRLSGGRTPLGSERHEGKEAQAWANMFGIPWRKTTEEQMEAEMRRRMFGR